MREAEECYAAALAGLPGMGPATLCRVLGEHRPSEAWAAVCAGVVCRPEDRRSHGRHQLQLGDDAAGLSLVSMPYPAPAGVSPDGASAAWSQAAARVDPPTWWPRFAEEGIRVTWRGQDDYPAPLVDDPQPPGVLFWRGSLGWLERPRVAIVGTRSASPDGLSVAFEMGRDLADAGVCVVSGLALGIDGACHAGALQALAATGGVDRSRPPHRDPSACGPVGIAASGVDVPYPRQHRRLWSRVAEAGAVVSETPPGRAAQGWMFPSRNRVIAGLADLVVVVESHRRGGSLITADAAIERGKEVRVVPGSVRSPASAGSNQLLCDGPGPVRDAQDILDALGIDHLSLRTPRSGSASARERPRGRRPARVIDASTEAQTLLGCMGRGPVHLDQLMAASGLSVGLIQRSLEELKEAGVVGETRGWWHRR